MTSFGVCRRAELRLIPFGQAKGEVMPTRFPSRVSAVLLLLLVSSASAAEADKDALPREIAILERPRYTAITCDLAFSPDSKLLAVADISDTGVRIWDVATAKVVRVLPHRRALHVLFSPDGKVVATIGKHIKLWEVANGKELVTFKSVSSRWALFSGDSKKLAAIAKDGITILSVEKKEVVRTYDIPPSRRVVAAYPSLQQPVYAVFRREGTSLALVDPFTEKDVFACETRLSPDALALDREGKILAILGYEDTPRRLGQFQLKEWQMQLWDRGKKKKIADFKLSAGGWPMVFSPDGKIVAIYRDTMMMWPPSSEGFHSYLLFYETTCGRPLGGLKHPMLVSDDPIHEGHYFLAFSPDGRLLAAVFNGDDVKLWRLPDAWRQKK